MRLWRRITRPLRKIHRRRRRPSSRGILVTASHDGIPKVRLCARDGGVRSVHAKRRLEWGATRIFDSPIVTIRIYDRTLQCDWTFVRAISKDWSDQLGPRVNLALFDSGARPLPAITGRRPCLTLNQGG
jgi:hypothetical protein